MLLRAAAAPSLSARVRHRHALRYSAPVHGASHVRAASGVCWFQGALHIVQDDALGIARLRLAPYALDSIDLPLRADGARLFDAARGNKRDKPDLEDCVAHGETLWAFGSGSTPQRACALSLGRRAGRLEARWHDAAALFARLAAFPGFLTSELNLEGLLDTGPALRVFQRSNGTPLSVATPLCASLDLPWSELEPYLEGRCTTPPTPFGLVHYALPSLGGVRLTVTSATHSSEATFLLASAEASPNAYDDGAVLGSIVARIDGDALHWGVLCDATGAPLREKAEGIVAVPDEPGAFYVVFDPDDPARAAELCELVVADLQGS